MNGEQEVEVAIGLEAHHDGAEAVAALHLALAEEGDGLGEAAQAGADGGVVGGNGHGVGAALEEELLDGLVLALLGLAAGLGDLVLVLIGGGGRRRRSDGGDGRRRDGSDGDGQWGRRDGRDGRSQGDEGFGDLLCHGCTALPGRISSQAHAYCCRRNPGPGPGPSPVK